MDKVFILAQVFGVIAWLLLMISYHKENTKKIILVHLISIVFYFLNYLLLGALTGLFVLLIELIRDFSYYKFKRKKMVFLLTIPVYIFIAYYYKDSYYSLIPSIAAIIEGYTLLKKKNTVVIGAIIVYSLWVVYDLSVMSYTGALTSFMIVLSNIFIVLGYIIKSNRASKFVIITDYNISPEIFSQMLKLDKKNYKEDILWEEKYQKELYNKNKDTYTIIKYKNRLIGYVNYIVIDELAFNKTLESNNYINRYNDNEIVNFNESDNYILIESIVINPDYNSKKASKIFSKAIRKYFIKKSLDGYKITNVIGYGVNDFEKSVFINCRFSKVKELKDEHILYVFKKGKANSGKRIN